jgi:hypothetical protein
LLLWPIKKKYGKKNFMGRSLYSSWKRIFGVNGI